MFKVFSNLLVVAILTLMAFVGASAQAIDASSPNGKPDPRFGELSDPMKESLAKQRIKAEEKEYQVLLERGEEAAKIGEELSEAWEAKQKFSTEDQKKLERLEKIVKKIRLDLGAANDEESKVERQSGESSAFGKVITSLKEDTANLLSEIKKIGRHTISVLAIESSNTVLRFIRFLRFNNK